MFLLNLKTLKRENLHQQQVIFVHCILGNMVAPGSERSPDALAVSRDSKCLGFVGPTEYIVTIADARSLDKVFCIQAHVHYFTFHALLTRSLSFTL